MSTLVKRSLSTDISEDALTQALLSVATHKDQDHNEALYRKIARIEVAVVNGKLNFEKLGDFGITCPICLHTIKEDINSPLKRAVKILLSNHSKIEPKIFEQIQIIKKSGKEGVELLRQAKISQDCYNIIFNDIEDLLLSIVRHRITSDLDLIKDRADLKILLKDKNISDKELLFVTNALDSNFITLSELVTQ